MGEFVYFRRNAWRSPARMEFEQNTIELNRLLRPLVPAKAGTQQMNCEDGKPPGFPLARE